jgi:hypothetical protein
MDAGAELAIATQLDNGESLIWTGCPRQGLWLRPGDAFAIPFSLLWCAFAIFWESSVLYGNAPLLFKLWGIPFVAVGLYMVVGRFFVDARIRARTFYALTSRRILIRSGLLRPQLTSLELDSISEINLDERADRSGTITFGSPGRYAGRSVGPAWPGAASVLPPAFEGIPEARSVYDKIREARRAAD